MSLFQSAKRMMLTRNSIKEAIDTLPDGIVFFRRNGIPILCNAKMHELSYILIGKDLQVMQELTDALEQPSPQVAKECNEDEVLYRYPDRSMWKFTRTEIQTEDKERYIQISAIEYTELYLRQVELADRNEELREMIEQVHHITANVADITRQQELLNAKMRLHNKMGNCMLAVRQYATRDYADSNKKQLIDLWRESLHDLQEEIGAEDEPDALKMVIQVAHNIGVDIRIQGELPTSKELQYLLVVALRECVTNTKKHAEGTKLTLTLRYTDDTLEAVFTNDGNRPKGTIVEGGGLSSLREKVTDAGCTMTVESQPEFKLTIKAHKVLRDEIRTDC